MYVFSKSEWVEGTAQSVKDSLKDREEHWGPSQKHETADLSCLPPTSLESTFTHVLPLGYAEAAKRKQFYRSKTMLLTYAL